MREIQPVVPCFLQLPYHLASSSLAVFLSLSLSLPLSLSLSLSLTLFFSYSLSLAISCFLSLSLSLSLSRRRRRRRTSSMGKHDGAGNARHPRLSSEEPCSCKAIPLSVSALSGKALYLHLFKFFLSEIVSDLQLESKSLSPVLFPGT